MTEQELLQLKARLFDKMIDENCEWDGPRAVLMYLIESGCTEEELLALKFDKDDVKGLLEEINSQKFE